MRRALTARLPNESFVYLGDTARLPYGTKSADTVTRYAVQASKALLEHNIKMLVVACNTASSVALPALETALAPLKVIGEIAPGAAAAVKDGGPIAVIATEGTVRGGAYVRAIQDIDPSIAVVQQACPLLVPLAEEGLVEGEIARLAAARYLNPVLATMPKPRTLVLGCTHFPALKTTLAEVAGPGVTLVDSAETTAQSVADALQQDGLLNDGPAAAPLFLATDAPDRFSRVGEIFLGTAIDPGQVRLIDL